MNNFMSCLILINISMTSIMIGYGFNKIFDLLNEIIKLLK
jgi:hypothetical protein